MGDLELRPVPADAFGDVFGLLCVAFLEKEPADEDRAVARGLFEADRSLGAYRGAELAGCTYVESLDLTAPGGRRVPAAGVTGVSVLPTHRRQGILSTLMERQLRDVYELGREAMATLWASEAAIYGRFGYGVASTLLDVRVQHSEAAFRRPVPPGVTLRMVAPDAAVLQPVYEAYRTGPDARPGLLGRSPARWEAVLSDTDRSRDGAGPLRCVVAAGDGVAGAGVVGTGVAGTGAAGAGGTDEGYATYRAVRDDGRIAVDEIVATTTRAYAALWRHLLDIDLTSVTTYWGLPPDDALPHLLGNSRAVAGTLRDGLWARPVDLPRALAERTYAVPVTATVEVTDDSCPWNAGRFRVDLGPDGGECRRTGGAADVTLSAAEIGAVWFGGTSLLSLAAAGRVDEATPGAVARLSRAFAGDVAPSCLDVF